MNEDLVLTRDLDSQLLLDFLRAHPRVRPRRDQDFDVLWSGPAPGEAPKNRRKQRAGRCLPGDIVDEHDDARPVRNVGFDRR